MKDQININVSKEFFTHIIKDEKECFMRRDALLEADKHNEAIVDWLYYMQPEFTVLDLLMYNNTMYATLGDGDDFYDDMHDPNMSPEQIADKYYPFFDFVDKNINRGTKESSEVIKELMNI